MTRPSGKFVLRITPSLHSRLRREARSHRVSLNQWIVSRLESTESFVEPSLDSNHSQQSMFMVQEAKVIDAIHDCYGQSVLGIVLFGSTVRGDRRETSDIDLLIVLEQGRPVDRSLYLEWDKRIAPIVGDVYSPQFSHPPSLDQASSLWLEVAIEGEVIDDTNRQIARVLQELRHRVASGMYVRKESHGHPYWVRASLPTK